MLSTRYNIAENLKVSVLGSSESLLADHSSPFFLSTFKNVVRINCPTNKYYFNFLVLKTSSRKRNKKYPLLVSHCKFCLSASGYYAELCLHKIHVEVLTLANTSECNLFWSLNEVIKVIKDHLCASNPILLVILLENIRTRTTYRLRGNMWGHGEDLTICKLTSVGS